MNLRFNNSNSDYVLMVNRPELIARAEELGYDNAIIYDRDNIDSDDIAYIDSHGKSMVCISYDTDKECDNHSGLNHRPIGEKGLYLVWLELYHYAVRDEHTQKETIVLSLSDAIKFFPKKEALETELRQINVVHDVDYKGRCFNCHGVLRPGSRYCIYCGTETGRGAFDPFTNPMYAVYGPPIKIKEHCPDCGFTHFAIVLGGIPTKFCPECGSPNIKLVKEYPRDKTYSVSTDSNDDEDEDSLSESDLPIDDMTSIVENYLRWEKKRKR